MRKTYDSIGKMLFDLNENEARLIEETGSIDKDFILNRMTTLSGAHMWFSLRDRFERWYDEIK
jgi:hypothetical protein